MCPTPIAVASPVDMDYGHAMQAVVAGKRVRRAEWPADDVVFLQGGYLHIRNADGVHRMIVGEGDLTGTDWVVVRET